MLIRVISPNFAVHTPTATLRETDLNSLPHRFSSTNEQHTHTHTNDGVNSLSLARPAVPCGCGFSYEATAPLPFQQSSPDEEATPTTDEELPGFDISKPLEGCPYVATMRWRRFLLTF